jgi:hypothetical protein
MMKRVRSGRTLVKQRPTEDHATTRNIHPDMGRELPYLDSYVSCKGVIIRTILPTWEEIGVRQFIEVGESRQIRQNSAKLCKKVQNTASVSQRELVLENDGKMENE